MNAIGWAALCARSETNQPHEWPYILNVIRNRVARRGYPNVIEEVVRQPRQFSLFDRWINTSMDSQGVFDAAMATYAGADHEEVCLAAEHVFNIPRHGLPLGRNVLNFWSPVSMTPPYKLPSWNWAILRCFTVQNVDPVRFVFAELVEEGHPLAGPPTWLEVLGGEM
jgi:hypothetical protein